MCDNVQEGVHGGKGCKGIIGAQLLSTHSENTDGWLWSQASLSEAVVQHLEMEQRGSVITVLYLSHAQVYCSRVFPWLVQAFLRLMKIITLLWSQQPGGDATSSSLYVLQGEIKQKLCGKTRALLYKPVGYRRGWVVADFYIWGWPLSFPTPGHVAKLTGISKRCEFIVSYLN